MVLFSTRRCHSWVRLFGGELLNFEQLLLSYPLLCLESLQRTLVRFPQQPLYRQESTKIAFTVWRTILWSVGDNDEWWMVLCGPGVKGRAREERRARGMPFKCNAAPHVPLHCAYCTGRSRGAGKRSEWKMRFSSPSNVPPSRCRHDHLFQCLHFSKILMLPFVRLTADRRTRFSRKSSNASHRSRARARRYENERIRKSVRSQITRTNSPQPRRNNAREKNFSPLIEIAVQSVD